MYRYIIASSVASSLLGTAALGKWRSPGFFTTMFVGMLVGGLATAAILYHFA